METAALPWLHPMALPASIELGEGIDAVSLRQGLDRLSREEGVLALVAFGSRARGDADAESDLDLVVICREAELTPEGRLAAWRRYRERLGRVPVGVDLIVTGWRQAEKMAGSRWHVMGDVARQGKVIYVAG